MTENELKLKEEILSLKEKILEMRERDLDLENQIKDLEKVIIEMSRDKYVPTYPVPVVYPIYPEPPPWWKQPVITSSGTSMDIPSVFIDSSLKPEDIRVLHSGSDCENCENYENWEKMLI